MSSLVDCEQVMARVQVILAFFGEESLVFSCWDIVPKCDVDHREISFEVVQAL